MQLIQRCEEELIGLSKKLNFSYFILRLPDVIGERDSTNRYWFYQMWLEYLNFNQDKNEIKIPIPKYYFNRKTSFVYVNDIARLVNLILTSDDLNLKNEIVNVAFETPLTLIDFIKLIASFVDENFGKRLEFIEQETIEHDSISHGFPSVNKTYLSIEKLLSKFNFKPSDLKESLHRVFQFYSEAYSKFPRHCKTIEKDLKNELKTNLKDEKLNDFIFNKLSK